MPDGKILFLGGIRWRPTPETLAQWSDAPVEAALRARYAGSDAFAMHELELFDPRTGKLRSGDVGRLEIPRNYHAVAALLPDGRVLVGGSSRNTQNAETVRVGEYAGAAWDNWKNRELRWEIFVPNYFYQQRPTIVTLQGRSVEGSQPDRPVRVTSGQLITVEFTSVPRGHFGACLIRAGSMTHSFNADERYVELEPEGPPLEKAGVWRAGFRLPKSLWVVPPGPYLLFITANDDLHQDIPSAGVFLFIA